MHFVHFVLFYSLYSNSSVRVPWLQRTNFRDPSAAHADESDMVCFVTINCFLDLSCLSFLSEV